MTCFRFPRRLALVLLLYVAADFMDPSIPGVFFFDGGVLFVDGVIQLKSNVSTSVATLQPPPFGSRPADSRRKTAAVGNTRRASSRPSRQRVLFWKNLKHDDSTSFASSSESTPTAPLS
jgi:hypothetical protein